MVRENIAESRRLRNEMNQAGDEFSRSLRRIAQRGVLTGRTATTGRYVSKNTAHATTRVSSKSPAGAE